MRGLKAQAESRDLQEATQHKKQVYSSKTKPQGKLQCLAN